MHYCYSLNIIFLEILFFLTLILSCLTNLGQNLKLFYLSLVAITIPEQKCVYDLLQPFKLFIKWSHWTTQIHTKNIFFMFKQSDTPFKKASITHCSNKIWAVSYLLTKPLDLTYLYFFIHIVFWVRVFLILVFFIIFFLVRIFRDFPFSILPF